MCAAPALRAAAGAVPAKRVASSRRRLLRAQAPTWQLVREYLEDQIAVGRYPPGTWLPSVRELAKDLKINRNTVSKVYQSLGRDGLLEAVRGRGVRVLRAAAKSGSGESRLLGEIEGLVHEARAQGVSRDWLIGRVSSIARATYASLSVHVGFVECNVHDARVLARDLSEHLGIEIAPIVLNDVLADPRGVAAGKDIVATTLFHLQEVNTALAGLPPEVVGVNHAPSHETLLQIARLKPGITIAVACNNDRTLGLVQRIVGLYARGRILGCTTDDLSKLKENVESADVVIVDSLSREPVGKFAPRGSIITVEFHIEKQSIEYLRETVLQRHDVVGAAD